jgi:hypothetical protein
MKILENIKSKKVSRKNFIFYSGIIFAGAYMLIKFPFKLLGKREQRTQSGNSGKGIKFEKSPESVKRV